MPIYLVERYLSGISADDVLAAAGRAKSTATAMTAEGKPVRYLRSTYLPSEESWFCLFEAPDARTVKEANERAEIPFDRIVEAVHVSAEEVG